MGTCTAKQGKRSIEVSAICLHPVLMEENAPCFNCVILVPRHLRPPRIFPSSDPGGSCTGAAFYLSAQSHGGSPRAGASSVFWKGSWLRGVPRFPSEWENETAARGMEPSLCPPHLGVIWQAGSTGVVSGRLSLFGAWSPEESAIWGCLKRRLSQDGAKWRFISKLHTCCSVPHLIQSQRVKTPGGLQGRSASHLQSLNASPLLS